MTQCIYEDSFASKLDTLIKGRMWDAFSSRGRAKPHTVALVLALAEFVACSGGASEQPRTYELSEMGDVFEWTDSVTLEENADVINVTPAVRHDPFSGGFLVADARDVQFRRYDASGRLMGFFGAKGGGPDEFQTPGFAVRLGNGEILAVDKYERKMVFFNLDASAVARTVPIPFMGISDLKIVNDSVLLISGKTGPFDPLLHLWSLRGDSIIRSFFYPSLADSLADTFLVSGWTFNALRHDTIATSLSVSDTVYFHDLNGTLVGRLPLPSSSRFRRAKALSREKYTNPRWRRDWMGSFDFVSSIYWTSRGNLLLQYQTFDAAGVPEWRLLALATDGALLFEVADAPQLLTVSADGTSFYFVHPESETPDRWLIGQLYVY